VAPLFALYVITEKFNHEAHLQASRQSAAAMEQAVAAMQAGEVAEAARRAREFLQETKNRLHSLLT
jgi:hypothetical protein